MDGPPAGGQTAEATRFVAINTHASIPQKKRLTREQVPRIAKRIAIGLVTFALLRMGLLLVGDGTFDPAGPGLLLGVVTLAALVLVMGGLSQLRWGKPGDQFGDARDLVAKQGSLRKSLPPQRLVMLGWLALVGLNFGVAKLVIYDLALYNAVQGLAVMSIPLFIAIVAVRAAPATVLTMLWIAVPAAFLFRTAGAWLFLGEAIDFAMAENLTHWGTAGAHIALAAAGALWLARPVPHPRSFGASVLGRPLVP